MSELNDDDILFGKAAVLLECISPQQLQEALKHKEEFAKVQLVMNLSQILVNKNYIEKYQVQEIRDYATKLPPQIKDSASLAKENTFHGDYQKKIGRYFIITAIGQGAMGEVFKAYDPHLDRIIALKILSSVNNKNNIERFQREARTMAQLTHPNIVAVYDISSEDNQYFFAMDLIEGCTLDELLQNSTLDYKSIVEILLKIADAVEYAHSHGVIHRDLKPSNILMEKKQEPKITDFGLAKVASEEQKLSQSGMIIGTLQYMPPEQAAGKIREIDQRSDIYSLGAILYEMITNFPPFSAPTFNQLIKKITKEYPILPRSIRSDVPKNLEAICLKALHKKKENRYQTAKDFILDLQAFKSGGNIQASSIHIQKVILHKLKQRNIYLPLVSLLLLLIVFISMFSVVYFKSSQNITIMLEKIAKLEKEITTSQAIITSYDIDNLKTLSPQIKIQLESNLLSLAQMNGLLEQVLITHADDELIKKKELTEKQIYALALKLNNNFLAKEKTDFETEESKKEWRVRVREYFNNLTAEIENREEISEIELELYMQQISLFPSSQISDFLASNTRNPNKSIRLLSIRSLGNMQVSSVIVNGIDVQSKLLEDLKYFLQKSDTETSIEIVRSLALARDSSIDKEIYEIRENYKNNKDFYYATESSYAWIPISDDENVIERYFAKGNFSKCVSLIESQKEISKWQEILAICYFELGNFEKVLSLSSKIDSSGTLENLEAETLLITKDYNAVIERKDKIFRNMWQQEYYLAIASLLQGNEFLFGSPFTRLINQYPQEYKLYLYEGIFFAKEKRYLEAMGYFTKALDVKPKQVDVYFQMGLTAMYLYDMNTAIFYFNQVLYLQPDYDDIHFYLGKVYYLTSNWAKAIFEFTHAIESNPEKQEAYYYRAEIYLKFGEQQENIKVALNELGRAIELGDNYTNAFFLRAQIYAKEKKYEEALTDITNILRHYNAQSSNFSLADVYTLRARLFQQTKKYEEALRDLLQARKYSNSIEIKKLYKQILKEKKVAESEK